MPRRRKKSLNNGLTRQCGRFGNSYVIFSENGGQVQLDLTDATGIFKVEMMNIKTGKYTHLSDISARGWRTINSGDTVAVVLRVSGKRIPKYPVINSPVAGAEFIPNENVWLNVENSISINVEFIQDQQTFPVKTTDDPFGFSVPGTYSRKREN